MIEENYKISYSSDFLNMSTQPYCRREMGSESTKNVLKALGEKDKF